MVRKFAAALVASLAVFAAPATIAQDVVDGFLARTFTGANGANMPYRLFVPDARARVRPLPLIVYLHGSGGAGTDNLKQISGGNTSGTHTWTEAKIQAQYPAFVLAPQLPGDNQWGAANSDTLTPYSALAVELLSSVSKEFAIDPDRVYLIGQSRGGRGTWDLITKRPDLFAAAVPLCGDGNPARASKARGVAVWAFHGAKDELVPVGGSRAMVAALQAAGSSVKYTEYPEAGHNVWTVAFAERDLPDWLFAQRRGSR